jgi:hypothetical protein
MALAYAITFTSKTLLALMLQRLIIWQKETTASRAMLAPATAQA